MAAKKKARKKARGRSLAQIPTGSTKVLFFTATWCQPCQVLKKWLAKNPAIAALVETIDVDLEPARAEKLGVDSMPTLVRPDGERMIGLGPIAEVRAFITKGGAS